jgi:hypothetical protein
MKSTRSQFTVLPVHALIFCFLKIRFNTKYPGVPIHIAEVKGSTTKDHNMHKGIALNAGYPLYFT